MNIYKGDIFYVQKSGRIIGSEQNSNRPAVVVSNDIGNEHSGIVEVVYLTSQPKKDLPTHAKVLCSVPSTALCEQIHTVSKERLGAFIRTCTPTEMNDIDAKLMISLGLNGSDETQNDSEEVEKLKNQLKEAGVKIKELKSDLKESKEVLEEAYNFPKASEAEVNEYMIRLETERDLYKQQYETLFERLINQ